MEIESTGGEEVTDFLLLDASGLRIDRVEPEVVPKDQAIGLHDSQHLRGRILTDLVIQDGTEGRILEHDAEGVVRIRKALRVGA
jgi:hypothetical protein